jgi:hypothetical protein
MLLPPPTLPPPRQVFLLVFASHYLRVVPQQLSSTLGRILKNIFPVSPTSVGAKRLNRNSLLGLSQARKKRRCTSGPSLFRFVWLLICHSLSLSLSLSGPGTPFANYLPSLVRRCLFNFGFRLTDTCPSALSRLFVSRTEPVANSGPHFPLILALVRRPVTCFHRCLRRRSANPLN